MDNNSCKIIHSPLCEGCVLCLKKVQNKAMIELYQKWAESLAIGGLPVNPRLAAEMGFQAAFNMFAGVVEIVKDGAGPRVGDLCLKASTHSSCHFCGMDRFFDVDENTIQLYPNSNIIQRNNRPVVYLSQLCGNNTTAC